MAILVLSAKDYQCFYEISNVRVGKVICFFFSSQKNSASLFCKFPSSLQSTKAYSSDVDL